jgi:hypothetical protein
LGGEGLLCDHGRTMRTLILSDLFLGAERVHAGGPALASLLRRAAGTARVIFCGNTFDFLANDDPAELDEAVAARRVTTLLATPDAANALAALGALLAAGGEATMRFGATDVELFFPSVQAMVRAALLQPDAIARRLSFVYGDAPEPVEAGGTHVIAAHGEHMDDGSRVDYFRLPGPDGTPPLKGGEFRRPGGPLLSKQFLSPLRSGPGMGFVDLLRPNYRAALASAMAVDPGALKVLGANVTLRLVGQLVASTGIVASFDDDGEVPLGLGEHTADLSDEESRALQDFLQAPPVDPDMPASFGEDDTGWLARTAARKIGLSALRGVAKTHAAAPGESPPLDPDAAELKEARRLSQKFQASVVILGHTGLARWKQDQGLLYANTGTWAFRLAMPRADAKDAEWDAFLEKLRKDPSGALACTQRLTCATVEPAPGAGVLGGAVVRLCAVGADGELSTLQEALVPPTVLR